MKKHVRKLICMLIAVALVLIAPNRTAKADSGDIEDFVTRLYTLCLNREPDASGLNDWCTLLSNGSYTGTQVAHGFVFSDEFIATGYSDEEFVQQMYRIFLGREYDAEGMETWLGLMQNSGYGREAIFNGFSQSVEFGGICAGYGIEQGGAVGKVADDISSFVIRFYQVFFGRGADPSGLQTWTAALKDKTMSASEVASGFVFSDEFLRKNCDDATFVKYMYTAFLDRGADSEGLQTWTDCLRNGWTREQVFEGFVDSDEFARICEEYGITREGEGDVPGETPTYEVKIEEITPLSDGSTFISCGGDVIITQKDGKYGAIKKSGKTIVENKYESWWSGPNTEGQFILMKDGTAYCYDAEGNMIHSIENPVQINVSEGYITYICPQEIEYGEEFYERDILMIYDIKNKELRVPDMDYNDVCCATRVSPVFNGKLFLSYSEAIGQYLYEIDTVTLEVKQLYWMWQAELTGFSEGYGTLLEYGAYDAVGVIGKDSKERIAVEVDKIIDYVKLEIDKETYRYEIVGFMNNGSPVFNVGKQLVLKIIDTDTGNETYFLLDFTDAILEEVVVNEMQGIRDEVVTNISDIVKAQYAYIDLSLSGNYLTQKRKNDWCYINTEGDVVADYVDCSDYVGEYAVVIEEDGLAYVIDTKFNKVSKGYPADSVASFGGALGIMKDGQCTLLYVTEGQ